MSMAEYVLPCGSIRGFQLAVFLFNLNFYLYLMPCDLHRPNVALAYPGLVYIVFVKCSKC